MCRTFFIERCWILQSHVTSKVSILESTFNSYGNCFRNCRKGIFSLDWYSNKALEREGWKHDGYTNSLRFIRVIVYAQHEFSEKKEKEWKFTNLKNWLSRHAAHFSNWIMNRQKEMTRTGRNSFNLPHTFKEENFVLLSHQSHLTNLGLNYT